MQPALSPQPEAPRWLVNAATVASILWMLTCAAYAATPAVAVVAPAVIVDGDTVSLDGVRIRLLDIDTPETHRPRCDAEYVVGLQAKQKLRELLDGGAVTYAPHGRDRYGRVLAHVYAAGRDVGAELLAAKLALQWTPGRVSWLQRARHWCPAYIGGSL